MVCVDLAWPSPGMTDKTTVHNLLWHWFLEFASLMEWLGLLHGHVGVDFSLGFLGADFWVRIFGCRFFSRILGCGFFRGFCDGLCVSMGLSLRKPLGVRAICRACCRVSYRKGSVVDSNSFAWQVVTSSSHFGLDFHWRKCKSETPE